MTSQKCVVEGCNLEYDVVCSFSFYNVNTASDSDQLRQEWIEGAMQEDSECLWRHVSLHLCGYHFELDSQGLWIDSPMLPELLTLHDQPPQMVPTEEDKKAADLVRIDHNYSSEPAAKEDTPISRLNVRQLVDTLGYLSLKNMQRKQLWIAKVETDKAEASITQAEQVIAKMSDPKQVIEILPTPTTSTEVQPANEVLHIMEEDATMGDNFIYEIAEEQEITMDEVKEIPASENQEWMVNIVPEESKPRYAYIKHTPGKKKRHFTSEMNEITLQGDFENYYILPDADPSIGVEITTSYEPQDYVVEEYEHMVFEERPRKRNKDSLDSAKKKKKRLSATTIKDGERVKIIKAQISPSSLKDGVKIIKTESGEDWTIDNNSIVYEQDVSEDYDDKKVNSRVRRKNKKYLGYDFVT